MQCSAGKRRLRSNPCRTERMLGRWTNCSTKRWLWNRQTPMHLAHHNICYTYPQHCICLNITVLYPTLHQYKHCHTVLAQTSLYCIAHYTSTNTALAQTSLYCIPHYTSANTALAQTSLYCIPHYTSTNTVTLYLPKHHCTVSHTTPVQTCNLHSSKRWRWSGWCYAPPCTHPSGREVCGMTCSLPAQC